MHQLNNFIQFLVQWEREENIPTIQLDICDY